jgi:putative ABC transport system permease protein
MTTIPLRYNLRSLLVRRATTAATAFGIALVVFVLASALMLAEGVKRTMGSSGRPDVAIVLRKGSGAELESGVDDPQVGLILAQPGVKQEKGQPIGVGEVVVVSAMEKVGADGVTNAQLRGIAPESYLLRPHVKVIAGRKPNPGTDEAMIGARIRGRIKGLELGQSFDIKKNRPVQVVGVFEDGGSSHESEVWIDRDVLKSAFGREGGMSSVRVVLDSPATFDVFQAGVEQDKRLGLMAQRETTYYEKQSEGTSLFISVLGSMVAFFFSLGAMIGASITMYASVANRQREIGTLRALGFGRASILLCFLAEAVLLALVGGALGALASLAMGSVSFSMINFQSWSEMVFTFRPTPQIMVTSLVAAMAMGVVGGFLPAVRAARVSPLTAMRG